VDLTPITAVKMNIVRSPRGLEQLRNAVRMSLYLEIKSLSERICPGDFNKAECARMAVAMVNHLCGEAPAPGGTNLTAAAAVAVEGMLARIKDNEPDVCVAASFMRWSKAIGLLMRLKNDEAETDLNEAVELNPKNAFALCSLAYLAGFQGDAKRAIELAKRSLELDPALAEAWIELGNAYEAGGEHNMAMAAWEKAQSLNPDIMRAQARDRPESGPLDLPGRDRPETYEVISDEPDK
jgi:tetratricopeptide (TPR) repeat protein